MSPGGHADDRAQHIVGKWNPAGAGGQIDQRERCDRHEPDRRDGQHAAPQNRAPDAIEPRTHQMFDRIAADRAPTP